jgi:hypothetical protein
LIRTRIESRMTHAVLLRRRPSPLRSGTGSAPRIPPPARPHAVLPSPRRVPRHPRSTWNSQCSGAPISGIPTHEAVLDVSGTASPPPSGRPPEGHAGLLSDHWKYRFISTLTFGPVPSWTLSQISGRWRATAPQRRRIPRDRRRPWRLESGSLDSPPRHPGISRGRQGLRRAGLSGGWIRTGPGDRFHVGCRRGRPAAPGRRPDRRPAPEGHRPR